ncbi:hypothetical protein YC2023_098263 [Brassica napus]
MRMCTSSTTLSNHPQIFVSKEDHVGRMRNRIDGFMGMLLSRILPRLTTLSLPFLQYYLSRPLQSNSKRKARKESTVRTNFIFSVFCQNP